MLVLEKSTNTHTTKSEVKCVKELSDMTTMLLEIPKDKLIVEHGHHFQVATEPTTKFAIKITQQEYNPIQKLMQNAYD